MKTKHLSLAGLLLAGALAGALVLAGCDNPGGGGGDDDKTYALGDTGPGGGKIFYVSEAGFTLYTTAADTTGILCHYLEAAPADISGTKAWASSEYIFIPISGTETAIGTGRKNTALILATDANAPAAKACNDLTTGGKSDWFLPSKDELNYLYEGRSAVGNLDTSIYWSSSQGSSEFAWHQSFGDGNQYNYNKYHTYSVRPVRAF
jgi:hypothetical protein